MIDEGSIVGRFRLGPLLGQGSRGRVFRAEHLEYPQTVALKLFASTSAADPAPPYDLDHPNIVRCLGAGRLPAGPHFLLLELVDGQSMDSACDTARLTFSERLQLIDQMLRALEFAHSHLALHGDLKPANVLVSRDHQVKLLDFHGSQASLLAPSFSDYTPQFASPERRLGSPASVADDIFATGLILRLILSGIPATAAPADRMSALLQRVAPDELECSAAARRSSPRKLLAALRGDLDAIIQKALAAKPEARYATIDALRRDLEHFSTGQPIRARRTGPLERGWSWARHNRAISGVAALLALLIVAGTAGVLWQAVRAERARTRTESQLLELIQRNGKLDRELYAATSALTGAEAARAVLLDRAQQTLDELAANARQDPALAQQVSLQYQHLADLNQKAGRPAQARTALLRAAEVLR